MAVALGAVLSSPRVAGAAPSDGRFGERGAFVVSMERLLGFQNQQFAESGSSWDSTGFHPFAWSGLGLFGMSASGLNFGALVGVTRLTLDTGDGAFTSHLVQVRPRVGFAGTEKEGRFGYWVRLGPGALFTFSSDDGGGGSISSDDKSSYAFSLGGEAYAVVFPAPHVGVMFGPHADFHVHGGGDGDPEYKSYGLTAGLMGEFQ